MTGVCGHRQRVRASTFGPLRHLSTRARFTLPANATWRQNSKRQPDTLSSSPEVSFIVASSCATCGAGAGGLNVRPRSRVPLLAPDRSLGVAKSVEQSSDTMASHPAFKRGWRRHHEQDSPGWRAGLLHVRWGMSLCSCTDYLFSLFTAFCAVTTYSSCCSSATPAWANLAFCSVLRMIHIQRATSAPLALTS